ncbi:hypothetical protein [Glaciibacter psychrotolerans]|uniref:Uncharacterized protein n=1 Tax=Glaciibacter psychrotolerans TaxID=670054 RepID=A0A7Z0EE33_9MICO|nr:hypothetical protein [Leifsonia psychrotolerans]NYJ19813.1 hypothetical protein [Leifsonia psychrotolerans]
MNDDKNHDDVNHDLSSDENVDMTSDPVARLRAADPAAAVEPRAGFAEDVVAGTLRYASDESAPASAREFASVSAPDSVTELASITDLSAERARRRPRWLPLVAVAASLALVGGAGFGLGAARGAATNTADGAAPPISMQGLAAQSGSGPGGSGPNGAGFNGAMRGDGANVAGSAGSSAKMMAGGVSDMMYPWASGRNTFSASGLSTTAGTARGYAFDARSASTADRVAALAAGFGIEGTPELKDGAWTVGSNDGTAPFLSVNLDGLLSFYYTNPLINPWDCPTDDTGNTPCEPPATLPASDAAIAALRTIVTSAGSDAGAFEFGSETYEGSFTRTAQAWPVVNGQRIDQSWNLDLTEAGIYSVSGALADIVSLGDYALVSEQQGFERLSDPRFGAQMTAWPAVMRAQTDTEPAPWVPPTEAPATPVAGTQLSWPVNAVHIVSARLGLTTQWQPDGSILVVPAYEFTDADGGTWSVIAVADAKLDFATK